MAFRSADVTALLDSAPDAMVIADGSGIIVFANAQTKTLFGYPAAQLVGKGSPSNCIIKQKKMKIKLKS